MHQLPDCPPIHYTRRRGQRNIRIRVKPDLINVSGPWHCPERTMVSFVLEKEDWIRKSISKMHSKQSANHLHLDEHKNDVLLRGRWLPIIIRHARPGEKEWLLVERDGRIDAYPPDSAGQPSLFAVHQEPTEVPSDVKRIFLYETARKELPKHFERVAQHLPFKWTRLFIRSQKTKWGTCSSKGNISLNWRLILCPPTIVDYLVIHELCHTVHMNHSIAYWKLVKSHYSQVDEANKWLKTQGNLCFLI
jgi:predicted metal-dependent hydrolase